MKANIHPTWYPEARVRCACGNEFVVGATLPEIHVEVCSHCHPFYTGQARYVDTAGRVEQFKAKQAFVKDGALGSKKERRVQRRKQKLEEELLRPSSLEEVRKTS